VLGVAYWCALPAHAQSNPVAEVEASRRRIKPVVAEYRETVQVANPVPDKPRTITWGSKDSTEVITCGVSAESMFITRYPQDPKMPLASGGVNTNIRREGLTYSVIESGGRGLFLKHILETSFPIAGGFIVAGDALSEYAKIKEIKTASPDGLTLSDSSGNNVITLCRRGSQTLIAKIVMRSPKYVITTENLEWVESNGNSFPKVQFIDVRNIDGTPDRTFKYEFLKFVSAKGAPFTAEWKEGATVKDGDSGIVYMMQNGKLVPDPAFSKKTAEETTQRRLLFLACFLTAGGGIAYWLSRRSRAKAAQA
jgi:hypothetical protein